MKLLNNQNLCERVAIQFCESAHLVQVATSSIICASQVRKLCDIRSHQRYLQGLNQCSLDRLRVVVALQRELLDDGVQLVVGLEEEGDVEDVERPVDGREADDRERGALEGVEADLAENSRLIALRAAAEDGEGDPIARRRLPVDAHLLETLVPDGAVGDDRGQLDRGRLGDEHLRQRKRQQRDQSQSGAPGHGSPRFECVSWPRASRSSRLRPHIP